MTEEEVLRLQKENQELREALKQTQDLLRVALARIEELEKLKTPPPAFVKTNVQKPATEEKTPRKKRESHYNRARRRSQPTQIVEHHLAMCPDCDLRLGGISLARCREVIDIPPPPPVQITEHRILVVAHMRRMAQIRGKHFRTQGKGIIYPENKTPSFSYEPLPTLKPPVSEDTLTHNKKQIVLLQTKSGEYAPLNEDERCALFTQRIL